MPRTFEHSLNVGRCGDFLKNGKRIDSGKEKHNSLKIHQDAIYAPFQYFAYAKARALGYHFYPSICLLQQKEEANGKGQAGKRVMLLQDCKENRLPRETSNHKQQISLIPDLSGIQYPRYSGMFSHSCRRRRESQSRFPYISAQSVRLKNRDFAIWLHAVSSLPCSEVHLSH